MNGQGSGRVRCAVYTRKSTEEGLDQAFNSLDAQREACEAYIKSQTGEGWRALPERYDDGGFSGGNMERPAVKRLLADIEAGKVDIIVVYKVDRLTRSLMDFARIVERLDARGVSFVSVTQAFNTTTSMGRLTLNVLLSFAQFEREVTGERIRDKIAASKAKGMWMGGNVPLGYDLGDRKLVINEAEAATVRHIFQRYVELRSGVDLMTELHRDGIVSKCWTSRSGEVRGGRRFSAGALYYILQNRLYRGEVVHCGVRHQGEHEPIVSQELFDAVQEALATNRRERGKRSRRSDTCVLAGLVYDSDGEQLTTSFSYGRGARKYRYYVSPSLTPAGLKFQPTRPGIRVPAAPLEKLVFDCLRKLNDSDRSWPELQTLVTRIELWERSIQLTIDPASLLEPHEPFAALIRRLERRTPNLRIIAAEREELCIIVDREPTFRGGKCDNESGNSSLPGSASLRTLREAHQLLQRFGMSPLAVEAFHSAQAPPDQRTRRKLQVGLLAPAIQKRMVCDEIAALAGKLKVESLPLAWADQLDALWPRV